jgi:hypothetical protein
MQLLPSRHLVAAILSVSLFAAGCNSSQEGRRQTTPAAGSAAIIRIDPRDTAAYADAGPAAIAAVARCQPPNCRPDIFRGPGRGELTVGLDSANRPAGQEYQWHSLPDTLSPAGQATQDSAWRAMLARWEEAKPQRLVLVDGVPRSFAYVRAQVTIASVEIFEK